MLGCLLGATALVRRPGVAIPGLLGGGFVALATLTLSGYTAYDQVAPDIVHWHALVETVVVPFLVGAAGTLWSGDPVVGKRAARLAAVTGGLGLYAYQTVGRCGSGRGTGRRRLAERLTG